MKSYSTFRLLNLLVLLFICPPGQSLKSQSPAAPRPAQVDDVFKSWTAPGHPGGAVAVIRNGEVVLARGYGLASLEYDVPVTAETVFNIASVSKQFTAFAAVLLAQQGKLSLDDDIRKHLPEVPDFGAPITIRELTTRAVLTNGDTIGYALGISVGEYRGLPVWQHGGSVGGYRAQLTYFPDRQTGIVVLTNFSSADAGAKARDVADLVLAADFTEPPRSEPAQPAVARTAAAIDPAGFDPITGVYRLSDGMVVRLFREGERFFGEPAGRPRLEFTSSSDTSFFAADREVAFIAHPDAGGRVNRLTIFNPGRRSARRVDEELLRPEKLAAFTGEYYSPELNTTYSVLVENDRLVVRHPRHTDIYLLPVSENELAGSAWFFSDVNVERNPEGTITGLRVSNGRVRNLLFEKR